MFEPASSAAPSCARTGAASRWNLTKNSVATGPMNIAKSTRGDRRPVRDERPVNHHERQHLDYAILDEGQNDRPVLGSAVHQIEVDKILREHEHERDSQEQHVDRKSV